MGGMSQKAYTRRLTILCYFKRWATLSDAGFGQVSSICWPDPELPTPSMASSPALMGTPRRGPDIGDGRCATPGLSPLVWSRSSSVETRKIRAVYALLRVISTVSMVACLSRNRTNIFNGDSRWWMPQESSVRLFEAASGVVS